MSHFLVKQKKKDVDKKKSWNYQREREKKRKQQIQVNQHFVSLWACLKNSTHVSMMSNDCFIRLIYIRKRRAPNSKRSSTYRLAALCRVFPLVGCWCCCLIFISMGNAAFVYTNAVYNKQQGARRFIEKKDSEN